MGEKGKIKLVLTTPEDRAVWANAERTAERVAKWPAWKRGVRPFVVALTCCGSDYGTFECPTWSEADAFRESYLDAVGHVRSAIIVSGGAL